MAEYKFGKSVLRKSAGDFKQFAQNRYPELKGSELNAVVEKYYGKDKGAEKLEASGEPAAAEGKGKNPK